MHGRAPEEPRYNTVVKAELELTHVERFRIAMELFEDGVRLMRQNLKRAHPDAPEDEIDARLRTWLATRPGAEHGDCPGRVLDWPLNRQ